MNSLKCKIDLLIVFVVIVISEDTVLFGTNSNSLYVYVRYAIYLLLYVALLRRNNSFCRYTSNLRFYATIFIVSICVSRIVWKKNLLFALQVINRVNDGSLQFDIYGSIEEPQYWEECLKIINNFSNKIKINYCGVCKHDDIPIILSSYDALFFPTFSENYGHIIAESLSVGLPIIISDQTPWSNINSTKGGWAIPLKDEDMYLKAVESIIGCSSTEMKYRVEDSIAFFRKFTNIDLLRDDYLKSFSSLK